MAAALALAVYAPLLAAASVVVWRRPALALPLFVLGLALHNVTMALLYGAGVRGGALSLIQGWKEVLLAVALASVAAGAVRARRLPFRPEPVDWLAAGFALVALVYAVVPQGWLGGEADAQAVLFGLRQALVPVAAYALGRSLPLSAEGLRHLGWTILGTAAAVAAFGLVDAYLFPLSWWRDSGAVGWYRDQLGFEYHGPGGLPENFAFNSSEGVFRRLTSTFLSPLASAFAFAVALLLLAAGGPERARRGAALALGAVVAAGLLFTVSRSTLLALAGALVVLAVALRAWWPLPAAAAVVAVGLVFALAYPSLAPETAFFPEDLPYQEMLARERGPLPDGSGLVDPNEPSIRSHLSSLRAGLELVADHPQGHGLGNAGVTAARFGDEAPLAGESNYVELGVELGLVGLALFVAWSAVLLLGLVRAAWRETAPPRSWAAAGTAAALAALLALAVQTDVIGVPWVAIVVWWLAGALVTRPAPEHGAPARA